MKKYKVRITPYALEQMTEIRDYIAHQLMNPDAACNLIKKIKSEVLGLEKIPDRFRIVEEAPWGERGIRKLVINNFYAYYWIDEENEVVHVTAVTYAKRNQKNVLKKMDSSPQR